MSKKSSYSITNQLQVRGEKKKNKKTNAVSNKDKSKQR